jgi:hypothetical protein
VVIKEKENKTIHDGRVVFEGSSKILPESAIINRLRHTLIKNDFALSAFQSKFDGFLKSKFLDGLTASVAEKNLVILSRFFLGNNPVPGQRDPILTLHAIGANDSLININRRNLILFKLHGTSLFAPQEPTG